MIAGLLAIGLILIASGLKGTNHALGQQVQTDFLGPGGFIAWAGAILAIGAIGYLPGMRTPSRYLLALLVVVAIVRNGGIWSNAQAAITQASSLGPAPSVAIAPGGSAGAGGGGGGGGGGGSAAGGGDGTTDALGNIASYTATGAAIGGPYGAAAGAAVGVLSEIF